ncbi:MAG: WGR domain-containing protein [Kofleriaceae bacterium]
MARYEFKEGSSNKFWQIELDGSSFTTTHGKIGTPGSFLTKDWPDDASAKKEYDKLVAQKTKKGYVLVGGSSAPKKSAAKAPVVKAAKPEKFTKSATGAGGAFNAQLAKQIDANPDDDGARAVYADWLQAQNDPRGELAVIQERLRASPKDKAMLSAEKKLLKDPAILDGGLATFMRKAGKPDLPGATTKPELDAGFRQNSADEPPLRPLWRAGFFSHVSISHPMDWSPGGGDDDDSDGGGDGGSLKVATLLEQVFTAPVGRFITSLRLGTPYDPSDGEASYDEVVKQLAKLEGTSRLRTLFIGDIGQEELENSWVHLGDLSKLYPKLKQLRSLTIKGGSSLKLGKVELPELRELVIITGGLDKKNLAAICAAKWPKLETLELWLGSDNYGGNVTLKDLKPIFDGKAFPKLKHLGLRNSQISDEIATLIPTAKIVAQLETLDLSKGTLSDAGVTALADGQDALAHLRRIDLSDNYIKATSKVAATLAKAVRTRPQRDAREYDGETRRYVSLSE